ncbi:MAG: hypothetical protein V2B18_23440 [Pseudomonadota bacterium]
MALGFLTSIAGALVLFSFGPHGLLEDLYLSMGMPLGILIRLIPLPFSDFSLSHPTCVSLRAMLSACLTWSFLLSVVFYCLIVLRMIFSDKSAGVNKARTYALTAVAGVIGILLVLNAFVVFSLHASPFYGRVFDQAAWVAAYDTDEPDNPRAEMAKSLQSRLLRRKPTKAEVIALLGRPELTAEANMLRSDCLSYNLGMWSGYRIDYDSLDIYFDANDRVCRACIIQH